MPYAITNYLDESGPQDGERIGWRFYDPESMEDLRDYEVLVDELPDGIRASDLVWDASEERAREKTAAEKAATREPLYGMEGLAKLFQERKAAGISEPPDTDELLEMFAKVGRGEVRG